MANQSLVRHINERRLLNLLRVEGPHPRAEIARQLGLTRASVTGMVDDLMARQLVHADATARDGQRRRDVGRPGIDIALDPAGAAFLGVEIGVGVLRFATIDLAAGVIGTWSESFAPDSGAEPVLQRIGAELAVLEEAHGGKLRGLAVTVPGLVRSDGHVVNLPILGWKGLDLGDKLAAMTDLPCHLANNANAAAFGQIYADPRVNHGTLVYLKLGTGCGGAVLIDGKLLRGSQGLGMEIGHLRIADDGPLCSCGQRGCLETFVNLTALQRYLTGRDEPPGNIPPDLPARTAERLNAGDAEAQRALAQLAGHLAVGLVDLTNIFNPDEIVLGGAILPLLDAAVALVAPRLAQAVVPGMTLPRLVVSRIGAFECAIGAASLAHHEAFDLANLDLSA